MSDLGPAAAPTLLAVPNVSEGRDAQVLEAIGAAFAGGTARLLDTHVDADHNRSVFTLAGAPGELAAALLAGARAAREHIDLSAHDGVHPHVGVLDVAPVVHLDDDTRGAACAEALIAADALGRDAGLPVLLYGALAGGRSRAELRRGGLPSLRARMEAGEVRADFGPPLPELASGVVLVAARPPLVAFNLELRPSATLDDAQALAAAVREGGEAGLPGVRAIGLWLDRAGVAQVSCNVEDHRAVPLASLVEAVRERLPVARAELVGLAPAGAFDGFPDDLPLPGFEPERHLVERALKR